MRGTICLAIGTMLVALAPGAAQMARPEVVLPLMSVAPTIDGVIDEAEWAGAMRNVGMYSRTLARLGDRETIFRAGSDGASLYIAVRSELPPGGELLTRAVPDGDNDVTAVTRDDSIELVVHPHLGATEGDRRYFHLIVNERGAMFDRWLDEGNPQNPVNRNWRLKNWQFANTRHDGWWDVEIAIPFAEIGATPADLGHPWGLRIGRNFQRGGDQQCWESMGVAYDDVPTMPRISFQADTPVVQVMSLRGEDAPHIELRIANPGARDLALTAFISDAWHHNPPDEHTEDLAVPAGGEATVVFEPRDGGPEGPHHTIIRVTSAEGGRVCYLREFRWMPARPPADERWTILREDRKAVNLQYAVYPYHNAVLARVDISALASKDRVTGATLSFVRRDSDRPLAQAELTFENDAAQARLELPELPAGMYEVRAQLHGDGVPPEPVVGEYRRIVFDWEHNDLGTSDIVIPPFTPIEVTGTSVSTVLRRHDVGGSGVWDQVTSLDRPLLTAPMRWRAWSGGEELAVTPGEARVREARPTRAVTEGGFSAGPLRAAVRSEWDYDGMAKVFVTLAPQAGQSIDRLSLEIPLDDARMPYMHACGDGLRHNYAGFAPEGEGAIWDSSQANRNDLTGTFYPYIWLGGGERGLAWFADSDRGWSLDDETPTVQLEREGDTLLLRINFVTRPTALDAERTFVFGLQATPAKPMVEEPVNWRRWVPYRYEDRQTQPFRIVGSCPYYGCLSFDLYPLDRDFSIYDAFSRARDTGEFDADFVARWLSKYAAYGIEPGSDREEYYTRHVNAGMRTAASMLRSEGWLWTPYTNARGMGYHLEEWPVFQDEWIRFQFQQRSTTGGASYDIHPTASMRDAAMWYYREMLRCFDGIYWDNIYLSANWDTIAGDAWVDDAGRVHPSVGLWDMRELIRRTAIMLHEQGRTAYANVPHMTNTNIIPILSFATVNLDWEWQYGKTDFQDRFTPDLTVAETIGRQCGNIPLILAGGHTPADDPAYPWMVRTRTGVCLVHEIRVWDWRQELHYEMLGRLFEFGYGTDDCRVYNYWDEGFPLAVEGVDARAIVLVNGPRAIVIVTDYGEGGECTLSLDLAATGVPATVVAKDLETGEPIAGGAPGSVTFPLKKHDLRAVIFE